MINMFKVSVCDPLAIVPLAKPRVSGKRNSLVAQIVNNLPLMQKIQVQALGQKDPLEKGMATHSSILAWKIPWTAVPGGPPVHGVAKC